MSVPPRCAPGDTLIERVPRAAVPSHRKVTFVSHARIRRSGRIALTAVALAASLALGSVGAAVAADDDTPAAEMFAPLTAETRGTQANATAAATGVERLAGADRFSTAVEISKANFAPGVNVVLIANGLSFPDALSGAPLAGMVGAPILLVNATSIPEAVKKELTRLAPQYIAVLGGTGAVGSKVFSQLKAYAATGEIDRISGADRFETSGAVADIVLEIAAPQVVFVANGMNFPDALAAGPLAGVDQGPLLLVQKDSIPQPIKDRLKAIKPQAIVVLGGTGAVGSAVFNGLKNYTSGDVFRLAGADRFETAATIASLWEGIPTPTVFVSSGMQFPDALAVAPVATGVDAPVLLVQPNAIPQAVKDQLKARKPQHIVIVGGTGVVSTSVQKQLQSYIVP